VTTPDLLLVVEDDPDLRRFLSEALIVEGFTVRSAEHGFEALRFLEHKTPALVVLDLMLPWLDGFGVLARMRQNPATTELPVIVITGTRATEEQLRSFQPIRLLRKPFDLDAFRHAVWAMVGGAL